MNHALPSLILSLAVALPSSAGGEDSGLIPKDQRKDASAFGFSDGKKKGTLADYRGKVVVVDFWTTWCPPCRESLPELAHLQRQEAKAPLAIIPVNRDEEGWSIVTPFLAKNAKALEGFRPFMAGTGRNGISVLGEVKAYPTTYLVDAEGKVAWRWSGYGEGLLVERLKLLLKELPPPKPGS